MNLNKKRYFKFYPNDIKRFLISALGLLGYVLIISVINDILIVKFQSKESYVINLINSTFIGLLFIPIILFSSKINRSSVFSIKQKFISLLAMIEVIIFVNLVIYFISNNIYIVLLFTLLILMIGRSELVRNISDHDINSNTSLTSILSHSALIIIKNNLFMMLILYISYKYGIISGILIPMVLIVLLSLIKKPKLKNRYDNIFRSIGLLILIYLVMGNF